MSRCFDEIKEEREAEIEAMINYIKDFEDAKEFLRCVYWLNYRLIDNNDNLRQYNEEYEEDIETLKKQLKDLQEKQKVVSRQFAIEQLKEIKKLFEEKYSYDVPESDFAIIYELDIDEIIDNQINKLKGEINE